MNRFLIALFLVGNLLYLAGCSGCSRSGSHQPRRNKRNTDKTEQTTTETTPPKTKPTLTKIGSGPTEVAMEKENGVYKVPVTINGTPMNFILDTGASLISITSTEADFMMKHGTITDDDIVGQSRFQDANGDYLARLQ